MDDIHKLPFLLGGFMAVVVGIISYISGSVTQTIYIRMAVVMVAFYIVGGFIRNTLNTIKDELKQKEEQRLLEEQIEEEARRIEASGKASHKVQPDEHKVDLVADDFGEDFTPLTVSRVISSKVKE